MIGDKHMYDASTDSRFLCRSLNINEDLGQICNIFSDKTGTLTQNKMEFKAASIHGKMYGTTSSSTAPSQDQRLPGQYMALLCWLVGHFIYMALWQFQIDLSYTRTANENFGENPSS